MVSENRSFWVNFPYLNVESIVTLIFQLAPLAMADFKNNKSKVNCYKARNCLHILVEEGSISEIIISKRAGKLEL